MNKRYSSINKMIVSDSHLPLQKLILKKKSKMFHVCPSIKYKEGGTKHTWSTIPFFQHWATAFIQFKQEAHGTYRSPEKSDQINLYISSKLLYHNVVLERKKPIISFLRIKWSLFVKPCVPFTWGCFVPSYVEIVPVVPEKKILKFHQCTFAIS